MNIPDNKQKLKVVAVTKGRGINEISAMLKRTNIFMIAENRLNESEDKIPMFAPEIEKHFIGKLQSRKIPRIVALFDVLQSVESLEQAQLISNQGKLIRIYLQVNISEEKQKSGAKPREAKKIIEQIQKLPNIKLEGVMGIASQDKTNIRKQFRLLKSLQSNLKECSMGMSDDYKIAIEEGATMLRLGRILFEQNLPRELFSE